MKNYYASDFALNTTNEETIMYRSVDGTIATVTKDDYLADILHSKKKTEIDFPAMKKWSDSDYESLDKEDYNLTWKNVSLHGLDETVACAVPSPEDEIIERPERAAKERRRRRMGKQAFMTLTEVQRRRYLMHHVEGLSMRQIADTENVGHSKIQKSLEAADKKIKNFLSASEGMGVQNA